jgi:hypothetical protein
MEMFGLIGGLAGAGASLAGGIMNAEAQDETNQLNWAINVMNMQQRERERQEAIAMALKVRAEQKLGTTDIRGTRTHFVPGKGWVVEGGKGVLDMIALQDAEQRKVLQEDLPMRRKVMQRNYSRGLEEEALADTFRRQLQNTYTPSDEGIASDLYNAQAMGIREASGDAGRRVFTQAMRTGNNSNFDDLAASMARENNAAYSKAALTAKLMSRGLGVAEADKRRSSLANLYNLFATRAQQLPETNYKPQSLDTQGTLAADQAGLLSAGNTATSMFAKKGGELDYTQPNMGWGNAVAGAGSALASAFRGMGAGSGGVQGFGGSGGGGNTNIYQADEFPSYA